jgi:perosamine synthetase
MTSDVYGHAVSQAVEKSFAFLKRSSGYQEAVIKGIPLPGGAGLLLPVGDLHTGDPEGIARFSKWRRENVSAYTARFPVTDEGTARWLQQRVLDVPQRMLFLVLDPLGRPVGHLGFANGLELSGALEVDNVVRGEKQGNPGIMAAAMRALIKWGWEEFGPSLFYLRVLSDNERVVRFYEKLGFVEAGRIPLRKTGQGESWHMDPLARGDTAAPDAEYIRMDYRPGPWEGSELILTAGPSVTAREMAYCFDAARNGWNRHWGDYLERFEKAVAQRCKRKYAMATSSCTGALHLSLLACGVGPGDEVIVPDMTWVATANAVLYCGATPVFADIDPVDWCLSPEAFRRAISPKTKAVMPVFLYGHYPPMDEIKKIAKEHGIRVIEDVAPAFGAEREGRPAGSEGEISCISFQGAKMAVTGEGGMILTDDDELYAQAHSLWDQGRRPGTFFIERLGWKYKMSNLQAAFGLGQVERIQQMVEAKRRIFSWYEEGLKAVPHISFQRERAGTRGIYWMASFSLAAASKVGRDQLISELKAVQVDSRPTFPSLATFKYWPLRQGSQPEAGRIGSNGINLPSGVCLTQEQVGYVCRQIRRILA